jgi:hypothetical protein
VLTKHGQALACLATVALAGPLNFSGWNVQFRPNSGPRAGSGAPAQHEGPGLFGFIPCRHRPELKVPAHCGAMPLGMGISAPDEVHFWYKTQLRTRGGYTPRVICVTIGQSHNRESNPTRVTPGGPGAFSLGAFKLHSPGPARLPESRTRSFTSGTERESQSLAA